MRISTVQQTKAATGVILDHFSSFGGFGDIDVALGQLEIPEKELVIVVVVQQYSICFLADLAVSFAAALVQFMIARIFPCFVDLPYSLLNQRSLQYYYTAVQQ